MPGTTDTGNHCDDCLTSINLPFIYNLYGHAFAAAQISSNGQLDFQSGDKLSFSNTCIPDSIASFAIFPYWDDLRTDTGLAGCASYANGCGVFTTLEGTTPNRIWDLDWHAVHYGNNVELAQFEVRLYENQSRFDIIYGQVSESGFSATVGVQRDTGSMGTQYGCNSGSLTSGLKLTFAQPPCTRPTSTPTPASIVIGHLTWQSIPQPDTRNAGITGTLTMCANGIPHSYVATTDATGSFTVTTSLPNGTYNWWFKGHKWLATSGTLTISNGSSVVELGMQPAGDSNNNNTIDAVDFMLLRNSYGKSSGQPGYDERADYNNDNTVNISDFNLQRGNYGRLGPPPNCP